MKKSKTYVWVTFEAIGFHCWPKAPIKRAYLRAKHRHCFGFKVWAWPSHDDREIEFHEFQENCVAFLERIGTSKMYSGMLEFDFGTLSCEQIAKALANHVVNSGISDQVRVECSEDGECGATVLVEA